MKFSNFTSEKKLCLLHGQVFVMQNVKPLACFCDCTGWFVLDPVGDPDHWFSHAKAQLSDNISQTQSITSYSTNPVFLFHL